MARAEPGCKKSEPNCLRYLMSPQALWSSLCGLWLSLQKSTDGQVVLCHTYFPAHVGAWEVLGSVKKHCVHVNRQAESLP